MARLLIADNSPFYRELVGKAMEQAGYEVRLASDGLEALRVLASERFDAVILDLVMPRVGGARACRQIKADPLTAHLPVIILSGLREEEIDSPASIGADAYVAKMQAPLMMELLRSTLKGVLAGRRRPSMVGFEAMHPREVVSELLEERRCHQAILESLHEGFLRVSEEGTVMEANAAALAMLGRGEAELINRSVEEVLAVGAARIEKLAKLLGPQSFSFDLEVNGRTLKVSRSQDSEAEVRGDSFLFLLEVSHGSTTNQEISQGHLAGSEPGSDLRSVRSVLASTAREISTPLEGILGQTERLLQAASSTRTESRLRRIRREANACRRILDDLLYFAGQRQAYRCIQDLNRLVGRMVDKGRPAAQAAGIRLEADLDVDLPDVSFDSSQMERVLACLLENSFHAVRSMPAGRREVFVRTLRERKGIALEVDDTGPGIPSALRWRIFQPFFTTHRPDGSLGLGLAVSYGIIKEHGGSLQALPAESGSRIRAFLPFIRKVPPHGEVRREMEGRVEEGALCQVLVVDDEAVVLDLVDDLLDRSRYSVYRAHDGVQALEYLAEKTFDVLLIDLQMPEMEGGRLLRTIAEQHPEQAGRVVLTSDEPRTTDPGPTMSADGHLLLPKPFFARDVEAAIHSICTSDQAR